MKVPVERIGVALVIVTTFALIAARTLGVLIGSTAAALAVVVPVAAVAGAWLVRRLPRSLDGLGSRRRAVTVAWSVLGLLTVVQTARLSAYMADPSSDWVLTTKNEFWSRHMCMVAYFYAADLNRQGEANVYDADHYPGLNRNAPNRTAVANLAPDDPYQYPPQFLLLPRLAIALSNDFYTIRAVWFAVQVLLFTVIAVVFARWFGGGAGAAALWLIPLVWLSVPSMLNFQYGQFHVSTIALAVGAFVAFERGRAVLGGALLAAAVLAKGFPGVLLLPLVFQRRWKAVAWMGAWATVFTALAWVVLGGEVFQSFLTYHIPRVRSGIAFAFEDAWPEFRAVLLAGNISPHSLVRKLAQLGVPGMTESVARTVHGAFSLALVGAAVLSARLHEPRDRAIAWIALVNLASMASPAAWGDYVPVGTLWLLTFAAFESSARRGWTPALFALSAAFSFLLPGVVPFGDFPSAVPSMILSIVMTVILVAVNAWVIADRLGVRGDARRELQVATAG